MFSQMSYYQNLLCKKRDRYFFDFQCPLIYQNNIIQPQFMKNKMSSSYELKNKNLEFHCKDGCNISFKSLQKKIAHHNRLDNYCNQEKINLYILLNEFQNCINNLNENNQFDNNNEFREMEKQYKKTKNSVFDKNLWNNFLN